MSATTRGGAAAALRTAYSSGSVAGLTDAQLLERFASGRDDSASFEALLARHGPMVLGVCRSLLRDEHAADDAFQATFLVLVRKAGSVRAGDSLGRWLYGVARKVAVRSRSDSAKRQGREQSGVDAPEPEANNPEPVERADLREAVHEELARLSEPARAAIVLCHLEGLSHEEAATRLGWPVGTVRSRLARGRDRLRVGLSRRGFAGAAPLGLAGLSPAMVPERLLLATKLAAARLVAGEALAAGAVPASVLTLTTGVLHAMTFAKILTAASWLVSAALIGLGGAAVYAYQDPGKPAAEAEPVQAGSTKRDTPASRPAADPTRDPFTSKPAADPAPAIDPLTARPAARPDFTSPQVLAAQLQLARAVVARTERLRRAAVVSEGEVEKVKADLQNVEGQIAGRIDDLEDELELLQVRLLSKKAGLKVTAARLRLAQAVVARTMTLNTRVRGAVAPDDIDKAEAEKHQANAQSAVAEADMYEVEVLIKQTGRKLDRFKALLKPADAKPAGN